MHADIHLSDNQIKILERLLVTKSVEADDLDEVDEDTLCKNGFLDTHKSATKTVGGFVTSIYPESYKISLKGREHLTFLEKVRKSQSDYDKNIESFERIAKSAEDMAVIARDDAKSAKRHSRIAIVVAIVSALASIGLFLAQVLC